VGSALKMLEPGLGGRHIALNMPEPLTLIHVDGPLFERVLINLLENAGKYAGASAQIGVDATVDDGTLRLDVWDTGPGIPAGQELAIFENSRAAIRSRPFRAWGWGWRFARRSLTSMAEPFPQRIVRKAARVFVLHFLWKPRQNLMNYQRICDQRSDC
jgi:K+-sensing histidine kinase KdpD